jgi:hypothetical protein
MQKGERGALCLLIEEGLAVYEELSRAWCVRDRLEMKKIVSICIYVYARGGKYFCGVATSYISTVK